MAYGRAISKAVKQAGKQQQANTRGLSGNRNAQGDFMPEDVQIKGVQDSVTPDIQNHINNVKAQIDEIDNRYEELYNAELQGADDASGSIVKEMEALKAQKAALLGDLIDKLSENGIPIPPQIQAIADDVYGEFDAVDDFSRSSQPGDEANAAWDEMGGNTL